MTKCDFCTQSTPDGKCPFVSQDTREDYCKEAIKKMAKAFKGIRKKGIYEDN